MWTQTPIDQPMMSAEEGKEYTVLDASAVSKMNVSPSVVRESLSAPSWLDSPVQQCVSPEMLYCSGDCRNNPLIMYDPDTQPDVISLSATADEQRGWESVEGLSMTHFLVQLLCRFLLFEHNS